MSAILVAPLLPYEPKKICRKKVREEKRFDFFGDSNFFPLTLFSSTPKNGTTARMKIVTVKHSKHLWWREDDIFCKRTVKEDYF